MDSPKDYRPVGGGDPGGDVEIRGRPEFSAEKSSGSSAEKKRGVWTVILRLRGQLKVSSSDMKRCFPLYS